MVVSTRRAIPFFVLQLISFFLCIGNPQLVFWIMTLDALIATSGTAWLWAFDDI
ncbi:MAG: hypothetical protein VX278_06460 [Myxococcota bacterium]|nr:hypothetical protein [Myxococcota bacterium]